MSRLQGRWPASKAQGELHLQLVYKAFEEDEADVGYREAEAFAGLAKGKVITDVKSAAGEPARECCAALSVTALDSVGPRSHAGGGGSRQQQEQCRLPDGVVPGSTSLCKHALLGGAADQSTQAVRASQ